MICPYCSSALEYIGISGLTVLFNCPECKGQTWLDMQEYAAWNSPFEEWKRNLPEFLICFHCGSEAPLDGSYEDEVEWIATFVCKECTCGTDWRQRVG